MSFRTRFINAVEAGLASAEVDFARPLLLALSGGPDSTALLLACCELRRDRGLRIAGAHFNHRLRGAESDGDARFTEGLCADRGVECTTGSADVAAHRSRERLSPEEAARELRYAFLARASAECGSQAVATGHTLDDQAETVLLHVVRGTGIEGLAGMRRTHVRRADDEAPPVRVVRPLLDLRRDETERFCAELAVEPRRDSSNEDLAYPRNRLRHAVLPELAAINSRVLEAIVRLAAHARNDLSIIEEQVDGAWHEVAVETARGVRLRRDRLRAVPAALVSYLVRRLYDRVSGSTENLELVHVCQMVAIALGRAGAGVDLPGDLRLEAGYEYLALLPPGGEDERCPYPPNIVESELRVPGRVLLEGDFTVTAAVETAPVDPSGSAPSVAFLSPGAVGVSLVVRSRRAGDRFQPLGMTAAKRLQDFFVDERVPAAWRDRVPLIEAERGIAWVAGYRPAEWARLPEGARQAVRLELTGPA